MKFRWDKKYLYWGVTGFLVLALAILFYYFLFHGNNIKIGFERTMRIFSPIIYGLVLAYLETPILNYLETKLLTPFVEKHAKEMTDQIRKTIRAICVILTIVIVFLMFYLFFALVIPQLIVSIQNIAVQFPEYVNNLELFMQRTLRKNPDLEKIVSSMLTQYSSETENFLNGKLIPQLNVWITQISGTLFNSIMGLIRMLWNMIIGLIISVYLLSSKEKFAGQSKKLIYAIFDTNNANEIILNIRFINHTFGGYISGKIADSLIIGLICFIGMTCMQLPYTMLISVIVGVTNIIPFFGPYIGAIPSTLLILMVNPRQALYFVIFILILQQIDGNFIGPKILGDKTGLSSFWVIFSITVLGGYFGILGMAIGVPIFAVIYAAIRSSIVKSLEKKNLSVDTDDYMYLDKIDSGEFVDLRTEPEDNGVYEFKNNKESKIQPENNTTNKKK